MMKNVPRIPRERISMQPYDTDYVHEPATTQASLDQQDTLKLQDISNQGLAKRNFGSTGSYEGVNAYDRTVRGNKQATMRQVQRAITINK